MRHFVLEHETREIIIFLQCDLGAVLIISFVSFYGLTKPN